MIVARGPRKPSMGGPENGAGCRYCKGSLMWNRNAHAIACLKPACQYARRRETNRYSCRRYYHGFREDMFRTKLVTRNCSNCGRRYSGKNRFLCDRCYRRG